MISYSLFNKTQNHSLNVYQAVKYCKECGENGIIFEKGEYHFYPDMAAEEAVCVSNHDIYGFRRIAFCLSSLNDFCIDGDGSRFIFHGSIIPFYINGSKRVTLKNLTLDYDSDRILLLRVTDVNDGFFDVQAENETGYKVSNGILNICTGYGDSGVLNSLMIRTVGDSDEYEKGTDEEFFCMNPSLFVEDKGDKKLRIHNSTLNVKSGMYLIAAGDNRSLCNIVINKSSDVTLDSLTMYSSYAMGVLAQVSKNITIDKMTVAAHTGKLYSLAADATHFVNCRGLVKVTNSSFSDQLDDALNIHGIFTKIEDKSEDSVTVRYMHKSAKGIDIYDAGDKIAVLNPRSLIGNRYYTVKKAEVINLNYTKLYLCEPTEDIPVGYVVENLTKNCDLIFEGNRVFKNRARGMLIGTKGKVEIKNNYFHTSGTSVLFESDGEYWFESGGTKDVKISENIFDRCCIGPVHWGQGVIETVSRREDVEGEYYHNFIAVTDNEFIGNTSPVLIADNIKTLVFKNNKSNRSLIYDIKRCETIDTKEKTVKK